MCSVVLLLQFWFDSQSFSSVHVERSSPLSIAVAFRAVFLPVAGLAVDFLIVNCQCGAVQTLPADHWGQKNRLITSQCIFSYSNVNDQSCFNQYTMSI